MDIPDVEETEDDNHFDKAKEVNEVFENDLSSNEKNKREPKKKESMLNKPDEDIEALLDDPNDELFNDLD